MGGSAERGERKALKAVAAVVIVKDIQGFASPPIELHGRYQPIGTTFPEQPPPSLVKEDREYSRVPVFVERG